MAACGSLHHIFEKPLPENPNLLESFSSWNQIKPVNTRNDESSFADEIFGELHFKEKSVPDSSPGSAAASTSSTGFGKAQEVNDGDDGHLNYNNKRNSFFSSAPKACSYTACHGRRDSFSSFNSENLQLCTEGLGFESSDDVEDLTDEMNADWQVQSEEGNSRKRLTSAKPFGEYGRKSRSSSAGEFPPPISSIGSGRKPWVSFKSFRHDGRFVLKEIRAPNHEFLHASREDGRLKLQFLPPSDDVLDEAEEEEEEEQEQDQESGDAESVDGEEKPCQDSIK